MSVDRVNCKINAVTRRKLLADKSNRNWSDLWVDRADSTKCQITHKNLLADR